MQPQYLNLVQATRYDGCNPKWYVGAFTPLAAVLGQKVGAKDLGIGLSEAGYYKLLLPENTL